MGDPKINELEHSVVYNVDDLKQVVAANKIERALAASEAHILLLQEAATFKAWCDSLETVPTIKALRAKAESIRVAELDKATTKLGAKIPKKSLKIVEELSKSIVNKLLHGPLTKLRCDGMDPEAVAQALTNMAAL